MSSDLSESGYEPRQLRELFEASIEMEEAERGPFLDRNCAGRPTLRNALERLLRADSDAASQTLWRSRAVDVEAGHMAAEGSLPFEHLGAYRILSRIGAGGMGAVYLAERDYDDVLRQVALKVIPRALIDDEMVRRFRHERQILARLEHPHIARMLDAGRTPDGMPYLVMEYVDGIPLDQYAASHRLTVKARLALFQAICDAVAYAHRNLIVHRDLKPRNILVTAEGDPKLLDFGIAKLLSETSDPEATSAAMMTPRYASPEQLAGAPITTASDVYSLGVILRDLLAVEKPIADLDTAIAMALREEPERRYASVADFAEDARRAVEGYPVRARPDTLAYRARRFVARRRWEVGLVMAMGAALGAAGAMAFAQYRAAQQRFAEVRSTASSFLFEVYDAIADQPGTTQARMLVARRAQQYLDGLSRDRSSDVALRKELAAAYRRLGDILGQPFTANLGDTTGALANYRKAAALLQGIAESGHADAPTLNDWARICALEGRIASRHGATDDAAAAGEKAVALMERAAVLQPSSSEVRFALLSERLFLALARLQVGQAHNDLARIRTAEPVAARALEAARRLSAEDPGNEKFQLLVQKACEYLAYIESGIAEYIGSQTGRADAVRLHEEQVAIIERLDASHPGPYRRHVADALGDLSRAWLRMGEAQSSEAAARESLRRFEEIADGDSRNAEAARDVMVAHWVLAKALAAQNRAPEASLEFRSVLSGFDRVRRHNPAEAGDVVIVESRDQLAAYRLAAGDRHAARDLYRQNIEMLSGSSKASDRVALALEYGLIGDTMAAADRQQGADYYRQAWELWEKLRDSHQLPAMYAGKPEELRGAVSYAQTTRGETGRRDR
jgi:eukaryotic-like serine/threonine-protein kinase